MFFSGPRHSEALNLDFVTEIRDLGLTNVQTGMKSKQSIDIDTSVPSASTSFETGITDVGVDLPSVGDLFELRWIDFRGDTVVVDVGGQTASMVSVFGDIGYQFTVRINTNRRLAFNSGCHNELPSYTIKLNGVVLYDHEQSGTVVTGLIGDCDVIVGEANLLF